MAELKTGIAIETIPRDVVAPWWHTLLLIAILLCTSVLGAILSRHRVLDQHHIPKYLYSIAWEWLLAVIAWWGFRLRRVRLQEILGERRSGFTGWRDDFILALAFWLGSSIILTSIGILLRLLHFASPQKELLRLAPRNALEFTLWIMLGISAGICEELIFRGYLLQQFSRASGRLWPGVLLSSLIFGVAHGYEGASGMIAITVFGSLFALLSIRRRSLRSGMMAHAWHDIFAGAVLMLLNHLRGT